MSAVEAIENFMPEEYWRGLHDTLLGKDFPWYAQDKVVSLNDTDAYPFFTHLFYDNNCPNSDLFDLIVPVLEVLDGTSLVRVKANNYPRHSEIVNHGFHQDYQNPLVRTCIYSVNTNNGGTVIEGGETFMSVANRAVMLQTNTPHSSTSHTDTSYRVNVVFNYI